MTCPRAGTFIYGRICRLYFGAFGPHEWSNNAKAVLWAGEDAADVADRLAFSGRQAARAQKPARPKRKPRHEAGARDAAAYIRPRRSQ